MSELFDVTPYQAHPSRTPRARKVPPPPVEVPLGDKWRVIATNKEGPGKHLHIPSDVMLETDGPGCIRSVCGRVGRQLAIDAEHGFACPDCLAWERKEAKKAADKAAKAGRR